LSLNVSDRSARHIVRSDIDKRLNAFEPTTMRSNQLVISVNADVLNTTDSSVPSGIVAFALTSSP